MLRSLALKPTTQAPSRDEIVPVPHPQRVPLAAAALLGLLRAYKLLISPLFAGSCRFHPSCSDYMGEAIQRFGAMRGTWLGLRRLMRCLPFGGHGYDPVPPRT
jgi:putative membrane protein insertion efficiency factor